MDFYKIPLSLDSQLDKLESAIDQFVNKKLDPIKFRVTRVLHGVYEQRTRDTYMVRLRCPSGGVTPHQFRGIGEIAEKYTGEDVHVTTRQELQLHYVKVEDILAVLKELKEYGISSFGGGGNTVRNIITSPHAGILEGEAFDVEPYAIALTTRMIAEEDSSNLPRKFKIAFSSNENDTAITQSTCLGFVAKFNDAGEKGFEVYVSGGMGGNPIIGHKLLDFIHESKVYHVARALKTMFDQNGDRRRKYKSRIKFLWKKLGEDKFKELFLAEYNVIKDDESLALKLEPILNEVRATSLASKTITSSEFEIWKQRFVKPQKQEGLSYIMLPLVLGDILTEDIYKLCDFLDHFGDNVLRCDRKQNLYLRNIPNKYLGNAFEVIMSMGKTLADKPFIISNMVNCTGAQTCKLGICLPRGLAPRIRERVLQSNLDLDALSDFNINISGCPNTCGMHHVADLGFFGKAARNDGNLYPAYNVLAGAKIGKGKTEYASIYGNVAAHNVPNLVSEFLGDYIPKKGQYQNYQEYLEKEGIDFLKSLCDKYHEAPSLVEDASYYTDFGAKHQMNLSDMGEGECSAGMFDMIGVDNKHIARLQKEIEASSPTASNLYDLLYYSANMLLVTRGADPKTNSDSMALFVEYFIDTNLVSKSYNDIITLGKLELKEELLKHEAKVLALAKDVQNLYANMDDSLKFENVKEAKKVKETDPSSLLVKKDFRGVGCPMNFVKAKVVLETMSSSEKLELLLDDGEPIANVPGSLKAEGHRIIFQNQNKEGYWTILVEKA
ncbi:MAG: hypothetical protein GY830_02165 [Bacteroidetes bacterium]|nr:hypothetical protein [Bacteroidota bacterium]